MVTELLESPQIIKTLACHLVSIEVVKNSIFSNKEKTIASSQKRDLTT